MLLKILLVGALAIGLMAAIRDGRILRDAGLLSSCSPVVVDGHEDTSMQSCSKGRLDGFPDLTNKSCELVSARANREFWRCEAPIVSSQNPTG
ncbi:MAG TPA: hypothetical protein VJ716_02010 [Gaiellaceae bacterium]|nr:hypothetical protein [Gaiellaceae bacterium]